jgi:hypothetical protein
MYSKARDDGEATIVADVPPKSGACLLKWVVRDSNPRPGD